MIKSTNSNSWYKYVLNFTWCSLWTYLLDLNRKLVIVLKQWIFMVLVSQIFFVFFLMTFVYKKQWIYFEYWWWIPSNFTIFIFPDDFFFLAEGEIGASCCVDPRGVPGGVGVAHGYYGGCTTMRVVRAGCWWHTRGPLESGVCCGYPG